MKSEKESEKRVLTSFGRPFGVFLEGDDRAEKFRDAIVESSHVDSEEDVSEGNPLRQSEFERRMLKLLRLTKLLTRLPLRMRRGCDNVGGSCP